MPDISMCKGSIGAYDCPLKNNCHRYTAKPDEFGQSFFVNPPFNRIKKDGEEVTCDYFWDNKGYKNERSTNKS